MKIRIEVYIFDCHSEKDNICVVKKSSLHDNLYIRLCKDESMNKSFKELFFLFVHNLNRQLYHFMTVHDCCS